MPLTLTEFLAIIPGDNESFHSDYDLVMVFPCVKGEEGTQFSGQWVQSPEAKFCVKRMLESKMQLFCYRSVQEDELYVLVRLPLDIMKAFADKIDYKVKTDPDQIKALLGGDALKKYGIRPVDINNKVELEKGKGLVPISRFEPYDHIWLKYDTDQELEIIYGNEPFKSQRIRLLLTYYFLRASQLDGGCGLELAKLLLRNKIEAMYPLHDEMEREEICSEMLAWCNCSLPWNLPFDRLRDYFGSQIALYYQFLGHITFHLTYISLIGFAFQMVIWKTGTYNHPLAAFYAIVVTVWSITMLKLWGNESKVIALRWGTLGFEEEEPDRPEFTGAITYYPPKDTEKIVGLTMTIILAVTLLVLGAVGSIYVLRWYLQRFNDVRSYASLIASLLNTVQISIFNLVFQVLAKQMTDAENHRTDTEYSDLFVVKLFMFQFVNSFASFFYLAFIALFLSPVEGSPSDFQGQCGATTCMEPLAINIAIIFGTRLVVTNLVTLASSVYNLRAKVMKETEGAEGKLLSPPERDYMLMEWNSMEQNIQNYADSMIQFGFMTLFVTALPISGFFAIINNVFKARVMLYSSMKLYQRPLPIEAEDIGAWEFIYNMIAIISVITNAGMVAFTMGLRWGNDDPKSAVKNQLWVFILFQWIIFLFQFIFSSALPAVPKEVEIQVARTHFLHDKLIDHAPDEKEEVDDSQTTEEIPSDDGSFTHCIEDCLCVTKMNLQFHDLKAEGDLISPFPVYTYPVTKPDQERALTLTNEFLVNPSKFYETPTISTGNKPLGNHVSVFSVENPSVTRNNNPSFGYH